VLNNLSVVWDPLLPAEILAAIAAVCLVVFALGLIAPRIGRVAPALGWRVATAAALLAALGNPSVIVEDREPLSDIAIVVVDESLSQKIGGRAEATQQALEEIEAKLAGRNDLELRVVRVGPSADPATFEASNVPPTGTRLFSALEDALAEVPRDRFAGAMFITDGQVHDVPEVLEEFAIDGPLHVLLSGRRDAGDRRLTVVQSPGYGIVGNSVRLTLRIDEPAAVRARQAQVTIRRDGEADGRTILAPVGSDHTIELIVDRGGPSVYDISVAPGPAELTLANNRAIVIVNGIRDRLRVLLVSGQPHPGERTWRNLLKADPSVDLVHFTILRPPEKQDGTPVRELSLIAFPYRELFEIKLNEFDLIIFDRYRRMGVLPSVYLRNIADYVLAGGALLEAAAPSQSPIASLYRTDLARVLPAAPSGDVVSEPFHVGVTDKGRRHPVTATLRGLPPPGSDVLPQWGRWFRQIDAAANSGTVVLDGTEERPMLILDRVGEGRVAQLLSDHIWLWARDFEGGGPHDELLRRLAHWLMKEPELEEDRLTAVARGNRLEITRRSLEPIDAPVTVTLPSGRTEAVALEEAGQGRAVGELIIDEAGLFQLTDGERSTLAGVGALNSVELSDVTATDVVLRPLVTATGGGVSWLTESPVPDIRHNLRGRDMASVGANATSSWLAFQANSAFTVTGIRALPLLPAILLLFLTAVVLLLAWRREGR
jgi:hypothetical protein